MEQKETILTNICLICYENKTEFIHCKFTEKHKWCLDCHSSMISNTTLYYERCPFCRTPLIKHDFRMSFSPLNFPLRNYSPSPPRRQ